MSYVELSEELIKFFQYIEILTDFVKSKYSELTKEAIPPSAPFVNAGNNHTKKIVLLYKK